MAISTRRGRAPAHRQQSASTQSQPPAAAASTSGDKHARDDNDEEDNDEEMRAAGTSSAATSTSSPGAAAQTPPASSSAIDIADVPPASAGVVSSSASAEAPQEKVTRTGETGPSGSNAGDTTSVQTGEWVEDADMQQEILERIVDLSSKNQQLSSDIELLKRNFTLRQAETNRLLVGMSALNKVESDLGLLQREYRDCARNNVALIQDALRRISYCSSQVDTLTSGGNVTATQLQNFRHECSREMDDLLLKLEDVESGQQQQQDQVDSNNLSTHGEIRRNRYEIEQLKQEINACKRFMSRGAGGGGSGSNDADVQSSAAATFGDLPAMSGTDSELLTRIDKFSSQLEDLHNEMAMLKQFLLQESSASRSGIEKLLARQMNEFQEAQDDDSKRLQEEMDELRSELCDVLKEMHLLKERTSFQGGGGGGGAYASIPSPRCTRTHCDHPHHCRYHYPLTVDTGGGRADRAEYAYPTNLNQGSMHHSHSPLSSRSSSPRRPSDVVIQALGGGAAVPQENQSCPSPHFSSRSSSISGRISMNRDQNGEPLPEEEVERRLLEQHRLFWIKEGAGDGK